MNRTTILLAAAMLTIGATASASAEYVRLGSVDVGFRTDHDTAYSRFPGRLESLRFTASRSDIFCRSIVVHYRNGQRQRVFSGRLNERRPVEVDLRGRGRHVERIRFVCRSDEHRGGRIHISGEAGRYRGEWRGHHGFGGMMGPGGGHGPGGMMGPGGDWVRIGRESFEGRNDRENAFAGWGGRHVDRIALRPVERDARCMSIVATFRNGRKAKLADGRVLRQGRMNVYDLPGRERNIERLYLRCRALGGHRVSIEIFARK